MGHTEHDVVVVGAGVAGLVAARRLARDGHRVVVLEAGGRAGGLATPSTPDGTPVRLGGDWLAADHTAARALAEELGLATRRAEPAGDDLFVDHTGQPVRFTGDLFPVEPSTQARMLALIARLDALADPAATTDAATPGEAVGLTLGEWLEQGTDDDGARRALTSLIAGPRAGGSGSLLPLSAALRLGAGAGSFSNLLDRSYRADRCLVGGAPALVDALLSSLSASLGPGAGDVVRSSGVRGTTVLLGCEATGLQIHANDVVVNAGDLALRARAVVLAVPSAARAALMGEHPGPRSAAGAGVAPSAPQLAARVTYSAPFWREDGLSGQGFATREPVAEVHEVSYSVAPTGGAPGVLAAFSCGPAARTLLAQSASQRRRALLGSLSHYFGAGALDPLGYQEAVWSAGSVEQRTEFSPQIVPAGADLAGAGHGHLEGAIRSGEQAAHQVSALLRGEQYPADQQFHSGPHPQPAAPRSTDAARLSLAASEGRES